MIIIKTNSHHIHAEWKPRYCIYKSICPGKIKIKSFQIVSSVWTIPPPDVPIGEDDCKAVMREGEEKVAIKSSKRSVLSDCNILFCLITTSSLIILLVRNMLNCVCSDLTSKWKVWNKAREMLELKHSKNAHFWIWVSSYLGSAASDLQNSCVYPPQYHLIMGGRQNKFEDQMMMS